MLIIRLLNERKHIKHAYANALSHACTNWYDKFYKEMLNEIKKIGIDWRLKQI